MAGRAALLLLVALPLALAGWRSRGWPAGAVAVRGGPPPPCEPEGRGAAPRGWIGCAADPGRSRPLTGPERLLVGLPLSLDEASAEELALVPGLTPGLAAAVVAERTRRGRFASVEDLAHRVAGIGPARLARARIHLTTTSTVVAPRASIYPPPAPRRMRANPL